MPHLVADPRPHTPGAHHKHPHEHPHEQPHKPHHHKNHKHPSPPKKHEKHEKLESCKTSKEPVKKQEHRGVKTDKPSNKKVVEKTKTPSVLLCGIPTLLGFNCCCGDSCTAATTLARADSDQSTLSDDKSQENGEPIKTKEAPAGTWQKFFTDMNDNICGKTLIGGLPPTIDIATPFSNGSSAAEKAKKEDKEEILASRSLMDVDSVEALAEAKAQTEGKEVLELESEENVTTVNETIVIYFSGSDTRPEADKTDEEPEEAEEEENHCVTNGTKVMVVLDPVAEAPQGSDPQKDGYLSPCLSACLSAIEGDNTNAPSSSVRFHLMGAGSFNEVPSSQAELAPTQEEDEAAAVPKENADVMEHEEVKELVKEDTAPPSSPQAAEKVEVVELTPEPEVVDHAAKSEEVEAASPTNEEAEPVPQAEAVEPAIQSEGVEQPVEEPSPVIETLEEKKGEEGLPSEETPAGDEDIEKDGEDKTVEIIKSDKLFALKTGVMEQTEERLTASEAVKMLSLLSGGF